MPNDFGDGEESIDRVEIGKERVGDLMRSESSSIQGLQDAVGPFLVKGQSPLDESTVVGDRRAVTWQSQYHIQFGHAAQLLQILDETAWWLRLTRCGRIDDRIGRDVAQQVIARDE
jgi:hypothetical protein